MRKWLILLSTITVTSVSGAPAWTWVDTNGLTHFSDTPVPGAKQIEVSGAQGFGAAARQQLSSSATPPAAGATSQTSAAGTAYRTFNIVSPAQQETIWNIGGTLSLQVALEPGLRPDHRLDVFLDGERRNLNSTSLTIAVPDVFRGIHTVQAVIVDQRGTEVLRSLATTFMVQQTSIQNPSSPRARP